MKIFGISLKEAGYTPEPPKEGEACMPVPYVAKTKDGKTKKCYARLYGNSKELPLDMSDYKAGQKVVLVLVANIAEKVDVDADEKNEAPNRYEFEILQCGVRPFKGQRKQDMSDEELNDALKNGTPYEESEEEEK